MDKHVRQSSSCSVVDASSLDDQFETIRLWMGRGNNWRYVIWSDESLRLWPVWCKIVVDGAHSMPVMTLCIGVGEPKTMTMKLSDKEQAKWHQVAICHPSGQSIWSSNLCQLMDYRRILHLTTSSLYYYKQRGYWYIACVITSSKQNSWHTG